MSRTDRDTGISYHNLFKTMTHGVVYQNGEGKIISANPAAEKILGLTFDQMSGRTSMDPRWKAINEDGSEFSGENHPAIVALKTGEMVTDVIMGVFNPVHDAYRWININAIPEFEKGERKPFQVYTTFEDITERKHVEASFREGEERYRQLFNIAPTGIYEVDYRTGKLVNVNNVVCEYTGYTRDELLSMNPLDLLTEESQARFLNRLEMVFKGENIPRTVEFTARRKDGTEFVLSLNTRFVYEGDKIVGATVVAQDVTFKKKTAVALHESEERFRTLVEESPLGISLIGKNGHYKYVNPRFEQLFGYTISDVNIGKEWFRKAYPDRTYREKVVLEWIEDRNKTGIGQSRPRVYNVKCKDGSYKEINFRSVTLENLDQFVIYEDITDRKIMEQQLQQSQKFEAIATLAGGVAHDFNNLLMGIQGRASLISADLDPTTISGHIDAIDEYIQSATDLANQLLGLARGGKYEVKPSNINELVHKSSLMFGRTKKEISIHTKLQNPPPVIVADRRQIEQVLLNLYVNAWQAMPAGGDLYLETSIATLDETSCDPYQIKPGRYAKISVTDSGIGMNEAIRQRIFDPFFTTKEKGRGTGLGLASAYGIIKNHEGMITVYSEPGHGSTFNIYLPISEQQIRREMVKDIEMVQGSETILLVDDEEMIIDVGKAMLEKLGYRVVVAEGGKQAIKMISEIGDKIDLVILDMIMPVLDGSKTFDRIREIQPELPVLLSSGYSVNGQATKILDKGCNGFIQKPFKINELSQRVRKVLDEAK